LIVITQIIGLSPYFLFTNEGGLTSIWKTFFAGRSAMMAVQWTVGRTGNINYNWGGYVAQLLQIGDVSAQVALFYAILIARRPIPKIFGWAIWILWLAMSFGSGTRGTFVLDGLMAVMLVFLKIISTDVQQGRRFRPRAYWVSAALLLGLAFAVQIQGYFRNAGFEEVDTSNVKLTQLEGNMMFTEGLRGYAEVPDVTPFFHNSVPGEGVIRPIPDTIFWFCVNPIPRAIWTTKPIDSEYSMWMGGRETSDDMQGTTIAAGLVGYWYFRYGVFGVIEGGLLFGWLVATGERAVQSADGKPMRLLFSMAFLIWLFRCFRDFQFHDLYPTIIGGTVVLIMVSFNRLLFGGGSNSEIQETN
jgi:hypothetical protein